jgi:PAS domain-containing protein
LSVRPNFFTFSLLGLEKKLSCHERGFCKKLDSAVPLFEKQGYEDFKMPIDQLDQQERRHARTPSPPSENISLNAFRLSRDGFILLQLPDQTIIDASDAWLNSTGLTRGEAIGKTLNELKIWNSAADYYLFKQVLKEQGEIEVAFFDAASGAAKSASVAADILNLQGA